MSRRTPPFDIQALLGTECPYCHQSYEVELCEIWAEDQSFSLDACCEGAYEEIIDELQYTKENGPALAALLDALGWSGYTGWRPRSVYATDWGHIEVDAGLRLVPVTLSDAKAFIDEHHRHHRAPLAWRFGFGVKNWRDLVAVATCGRPVARMLDPDRVLEVTRVCVDPTLHPAVVKDACSMLYGAAAREARKRGFERVIAYTLASERGTSLRAAGFSQRAVTAGGSWNRRSRPREDSAPTEPKVRWERGFPQNVRRHAATDAQLSLCLPPLKQA
jgi:hypothetical protein